MRHKSLPLRLPQLRESTAIASRQATNEALLMESPEITPPPKRQRSGEEEDAVSDEDYAVIGDEDCNAKVRYAKVRYADEEEQDKSNSTNLLRYVVGVKRLSIMLGIKWIYRS
ncbi:unnamed protein product [Cochlearia groenlandica]